jgi:hypothetical protein
MEIGLEGVDWIRLAQSRDRWLDGEHSNGHSVSIKAGEFLDQRDLTC